METWGGASGCSPLLAAKPPGQWPFVLCWHHRKSVLFGGVWPESVVCVWCHVSDAINACLQPACWTNLSALGGWLRARMASLPINRSWWSSEKCFRSGNNPIPPTLCLPPGKYIEKSIQEGLFSPVCANLSIDLPSYCWIKKKMVCDTSCFYPIYIFFYRLCFFPKRVLKIWDDLSQRTFIISIYTSSVFPWWCSTYINIVDDVRAYLFIYQT